MPWVLCAIACASGASALVLETLWFHQAGLALGNSIWASSLVLSGFMAGLALGNALAARFADRVARPLRLYAGLELAIAGTGVGLVYVLPQFGSALGPWLGPFHEMPWLLNLSRLCVAFALLSIPSLAMGVTLPLLTRALSTRDANFGRVLGRLYGWNTLGAVAGVVLAESHLIGAFGVRGSAWIAGGLNTLAASGALFLSIRFAWAGSAATPVAQRAPRALLAAAFLAGFALLALEVVWFRFLALYIQSHATSFALMLGLVLAGIASGGLAASVWLARRGEAQKLAGPVALLAGALTVSTYAAFPAFVAPFASGRVPGLLGIATAVAPLVLPVSFASGLLFTLLGSQLQRAVGAEAATTGTLTFANTMGAALGSLVAGFLLLPGIGMENSLFSLAVLYGAVGGFLLFGSGLRRRVVYATGVGFAFVTALFPFGAMRSQHISAPLSNMANPRDRLVAVREGLTETILYVEQRELGEIASHRMITNAFSMSATNYFARRYMKLYAYWPLAVHPNPRSALLISYGVGSTAKALVDSPEWQTIDVVDISRDVLELDHIVFPEYTEPPLHDPRVRVHIEDGRYFLQTTERRFDLITGEPPPPRMAGVVNLYTREYFRLLRDRLEPGGIATYWLPLHSLSDQSAQSIIGAFCGAFEDCSLWHGSGRNLMLVGTRDAQGPVSEEFFARQWRNPRSEPELARLGFERPEQLGALFIGDAAYLEAYARSAPVLTDDRPKRIHAPASSRGAMAQLLRDWTDVEAARERFRASPLIARLWPAEMREASLDYFELQRVINSQLFNTPLTDEQRLADLDLLLRSPLSAPALWLLGSTPDIQEIVERAPAQRRAHPQYGFHRAIRRISERRFVESLELLKRAQAVPQLRERALRLGHLARGYAGRDGGRLARRQK